MKVKAAVACRGRSMHEGGGRGGSVAGNVLPNTVLGGGGAPPEIVGYYRRTKSQRNIISH